MPMLQAALLCDAAQDYQGKISVLGGFVSIQLEFLPWASEQGMRTFACTEQKKCWQMR